MSHWPEADAKVPTTSNSWEDVCKKRSPVRPPLGAPRGTAKDLKAAVGSAAGGAAVRRWCLDVSVWIDEVKMWRGKFVSLLLQGDPGLEYGVRRAMYCISWDCALTA